MRRRISDREEAEELASLASLGARYMYYWSDRARCWLEFQRLRLLLRLGWWG